MAEGDTSATLDGDSIEALRTGKPPRVLSPEQVLGQLRTYRLFADLTDDEFREVTTLLRSKSVAEGEILFGVGGEDFNLYILRKGRALIRSAEKSGQDPIVGVAEAGDIINELAFTTNRPDEQTVEAATPLLLWYLSSAEFRALLADHDSIAGHLTYSEDALAYIKQKRRFREQRPGEQVLWFSRRYWWALFKGELVALALAFVMIAFLVIPALTSFIATPLGGVLYVLVGIFTLAVAVWNLYDWWNDYFVVTDQRVIHRERVLLIYDQQDESPMGKIQNVSVDRPGFAAFLFDVGNVSIETQGARANVEFTTVGKPNVPNRIISEQQTRARTESNASTRSLVRSELRRTMNVGEPPAEAAKKKDADVGRKSFLRQFNRSLVNTRNTFLPRMKLQDGENTIWRRHWLYLLQSIFLPALSFVLYVAALLFVRVREPDLAVVLFEPPGSYFVFLVGFLLLFWLVWQYENWRNDLYILTPDQLIDYKRSPFGLLGTTQKTAALTNVQNVSATTKGFIDSLFNMGDVTIRTGGVENEILFARVWNPRGVQSDIVKALEEFQTAQRDAEAARRRREFIEWIGIYDELTRIHTARKPLV